MRTSPPRELASTRAFTSNLGSQLVSYNGFIHPASGNAPSPIGASDKISVKCVSIAGRDSVNLEIKVLLTPVLGPRGTDVMPWEMPNRRRWRGYNILLGHVINEADSLGRSLLSLVENNSSASPYQWNLLDGPHKIFFPATSHNSGIQRLICSNHLPHFTWLVGTLRCILSLYVQPTTAPHGSDRPDWAKPHE